MHGMCMACAWHVHGMCMACAYLGDEGEGEAVEHDVDRIGEAAGDAARHAGHGGAEQQLQRRDEQHPRVLRQLLAFERQEPTVEVAELEEVAHVLEVDEVDVRRHPHAARELEEVHVPAVHVEDVLVEHRLRLEGAVAHVPRAALPVGRVGLEGDALPQAVCAHGGGEGGGRGGGAGLLPGGISPGDAISPATCIAELRISLGPPRGEAQQVPRQGEPGRRLERRHRLGRGVVAVDEEALRTRGG